MLSTRETVQLEGEGSHGCIWYYVFWLLPFPLASKRLLSADCRRATAAHRTIQQQCTCTAMMQLSVCSVSVCLCVCLSSQISILGFSRRPNVPGFLVVGWTSTVSFRVVWKQHNPLLKVETAKGIGSQQIRLRVPCSLISCSHEAVEFC